MMKDFDTVADLIENEFLDTPQMFLADCRFITERRMNAANIVKPIAALTGLKRDEVSEKIADLSVDEILDLIDAINANDEARVLMMLNFGEKVHEDDHEDEKDVEIDDELDTDDSQAAREYEEADLAPDSQHGLLKTADSLGEAMSIGQEVKVGNNDAVVKVADGPGNTAGVLIDGEMQMVDKKKINTDRVDETVLGMTNMPGLRRMLELAGFPGMTPADPETETAAPQAQASNVIATGPVELPTSDDVAQAEQEVEAIEGAEQELAGEVAADAAAEADDAAAEDCEGEACDDLEGADRPHEVSPEVDPEPEIMAALEVIEKNIRNLKVGSFKAINDRIQAIQGSLFESTVMNRKRI